MATRNAISLGSGAEKSNNHTIPLHNPTAHFSFFKFHIPIALWIHILTWHKPPIKQKATPLYCLLLSAF